MNVNEKKLCYLSNYKILKNKNIQWEFSNYSVTDPKSVCLNFQQAKTQNVRVWSKKRFIDLEVANTEDERPGGPQKGVKGKGKWERQEVTEDHRHPGTSRGQRKTVLSLLTLADVSAITRFLEIFDKQHILPLSLWERNFLVRGCFCKPQVINRIPLMIIMSMCKKLLT